jgi:hypothetical protein
VGVYHARYSQSHKVASNQEKEEFSYKVLPQNKHGLGLELNEHTNFFEGVVFPTNTPVDAKNMNLPKKAEISVIL